MRDLITVEQKALMQRLAKEFLGQDTIKTIDQSQPGPFSTEHYLELGLDDPLYTIIAWGDGEFNVFQKGTEHMVGVGTVVFTAALFEWLKLETRALIERKMRHLVEQEAREKGLLLESEGEDIGDKSSEKLNYF